MGRSDDIFHCGTRREINLNEVPDFRRTAVEREFEIRNARAVIEMALQRIPRRKSEILRLVYGFNSSGIPLSYPEVARAIRPGGPTLESRVRAIASSAHRVFHHQSETELRIVYEALRDE